MKFLARARRRCRRAVCLCIFSRRSAADKPFQRDDLADSAIRLEAKIKADSGTVAKPAAALKRDADAAFQRNDGRTGLQVLGQIATVAPDDVSNWLRLSRAVLNIYAPNETERYALLDRAASRGLHRLSARQQPRRRSRQP